LTEIFPDQFSGFASSFYRRFKILIHSAFTISCSSPMSSATLPFIFRLGQKSFVVRRSA
jgi:hypothetical protein